MNLDSEGFDHIDKRHFDATVNASQFSISRSELADILMDGKTVATPVTKIVKSGDSFNYVRELNLGKAVGTDKFNGYQSTSIITIMTDKFGNLVTAFPGRL
ncbi:adhesin [Herbaspirillum sp. C7C2]|nr:adhesin [Herbaspirillum sp. C7C2]